MKARNLALVVGGISIVEMSFVTSFCWIMFPSLPGNFALKSDVVPTLMLYMSAIVGWSMVAIGVVIDSTTIDRLMVLIGILIASQIQICAWGVDALGWRLW